VLRARFNCETGDDETVAEMTCTSSP